MLAIGRQRQDLCRNIRDALGAADPADAGFFRANAERYLAKLDVL